MWSCFSVLQNFSPLWSRFSILRSFFFLLLCSCFLVLQFFTSVELFFTFTDLFASVELVHIIFITVRCFKPNVSNIRSLKSLLKWKADAIYFSTQIHVESKDPAIQRVDNTIEPNVSVWNEPLKYSRSFVTIEGTSACQICWLHFHTMVTS